MISETRILTLGQPHNLTKLHGHEHDFTSHDIFLENTSNRFLAMGLRILIFKSFLENTMVGVADVDILWVTCREALVLGWI